MSATFTELQPEQLIGIQPNSDNTSANGDEEGGWLQVYKWCLNNPPALRKRLYGSGLFTTSPAYSALVLHLDGDLCGKAELHAVSQEVNPENFDLQQASGRGAYLRAVLQNWLQAEDDENLIFSLAIEAIETWLLAGLDTQREYPENAQNPEAILLPLYQHLQGKRAQKKQKKLQKNEKTYQKLSHEAAKNTAHIAASCPHFAKLCQQLQPFLSL
ncbi:hypothetical protein [Candidatus Venteria ishoeyi]|uniref:Uncharacterized protein n=1 Tax=Candidatus Venteria ishoeyi TaxID=1899563 RepID=A0A1H6FEZ3_9GAMM|nr:Uncharacterised protein [Candidatus Venteria ishoeyi]